MRGRAYLGGGLAAVLALCACSAGGSPGMDKGGGHAEPLTLTAWSSESVDRPTGAQLKAFVDAVADLSDGSITISPSYGEGAEKDPDHAVIAAVQDGQYPLGLAAARAFSSSGMDSLRALTAPFLIDSNAATAAVVSSEDITGPMLDGLSSGQLTGLTLLPETLRHPFGTYGPVLGAADYVGKSLRSLPSEETYGVFRSLGAEPGFWDGSEMSERIESGDLPIVESSFVIAGDLGIGPSIGTGNVTFFPRVNVLFASDEAMAALSESQVAILQEAAVRAREAATDAITDDAEAARDFCDAGGQVVLASEAQLTELRTKVAPYVDALESDPNTKKAVEGIRQVVESTPPGDPVKECGAQVSVPSGGVLEPWPVSTEASAIDGVYRLEIDDESLAAVGVPADSIPQLHGTFTWTLDHGKFSFDHTASNPIDQAHEWWWLVLRGDKAMLIDNAPADARTSANVLWAGNWSVDDEGNLSFVNYVAGSAAAPFDPVWWFDKPFTRLK